MVEFAGYDMPVMYGGILDEHKAVRSGVGIFDVSHMSNLWIRGPDAIATLNRAFVADASKIPMNGTKYSCALREDGTILDDLYIFHTGHGYHVIPNAGMNDAVFAHLKKSGSATVEDTTATTAILALQGPKAAEVLAKHLGRDFGDLKRFHLTQAPELGQHAFISRTGYTGEDGFELVFPAERAPEVFNGLMKAGESAGITPCGLGARDTLRLEKGYALAGHEFKGGRTPLEAGLSWLVNWDHDFIGKSPLEVQKAAGVHDRLVGVKLTGRGIPREGCIVEKDGVEVGVVTSGSMSPILGEGISLAYLRHDIAKAGTELDVVIRDKRVTARVEKLPFV